MSVATTALLRAESWPPSCIFLISPTEMARPAKIVTITASTTTNVMARARTDETGTQTVLNCGLDRPTKTAPRTNRTPKKTCGIIWPVDARVPSFITQRECCSIEYRASWSNMVVKTMAIWHEFSAAGSIKVVMKPTWAHVAALNRKIARTSLLPSRKIDEPWPLTLRNKAADAAFTTIPLRMLVSLDLTRQSPSHPVRGGDSNSQREGGNEGRGGSRYRHNGDASWRKGV